MKFDGFKVKSRYTLEVEGEAFDIELPSKWNRAFTAAWQQEMAKNGKPTTDGEMAGKIANFQTAQIDAFARHCLINPPLDIDQLTGDYFPLLMYLFEDAMTRAEAEEARIEALTKKPATISNGHDSGRESLTSTRRSKRKGELQLKI